MSSKHHVTNAQMEALLDRELPDDECSMLESHITGCRTCSDAYHRAQQEHNLFRQIVQQPFDRTIQQINWDQFALRVVEQIKQEPVWKIDRDIAAAPVVQPQCREPQVAFATSAVTEPSIHSEQPQPSWFQQLTQWIFAHPGLVVGSLATAGILLLFALPLIDPGPNEKDVIVDRVVKNKAAQVSVLNVKNSVTGKPMTVIVVKEPGEDTIDPIKQRPIPPHMRRSLPKRVMPHKRQH